MTKQDLCGKLQTIKNNYALAEVGVILMAQPDAATRMAENFEMSALFPDFKHIDYIKYWFKDPEALKHSLKEFRGAALRTVIKETYESVKDYCSKSKQTTVFLCGSLVSVHARDS